MISQDKGASTLEGGANLNMSELALLTIVIQEEVCRAAGITVEEFDADLAAGISTYRLSRAGMDVKEAMEVSGLTGKAYNAIEIAKDGTVTEIDLDK